MMPRPAPADKTDVVRTAYLENRSIAALARDHGVSRGAIRTAVADLLPDHTGVEEDIPAPELLVTLDMPGKVADFLRTADLEPAERAALDEGATVRLGQGYTLRVTAIPPCTVSSSTAANRSTAARVSRLFRPSARPVASTTTAPTSPSGWEIRRPRCRSPSLASCGPTSSPASTCPTPAAEAHSGCSPAASPDSR
ncbi:hypothetical protein OG418_02275 [Streptomyces phaeochromogenes]|uniref:Uncharacterized protein n=1 Tax=Streptomyces phaeochromogenes TaxID=1923 RepID=A0ABZ1HTK9_STRPH|nr:hypothetical protein [Streptomyces phaeochromogenes]WSD20958.1 hypothetical protein OHB35_51260 [Streptomyces phaeochromogenes]